MAETPSALKETSSVQEARGNPPFGSRYEPSSVSSPSITSTQERAGNSFLVHEGDVWQQNAWDHVPPPSDHDEVIAASLTRQRSAPVPVDERTKYNQNPSRHWYSRRRRDAYSANILSRDNFYKANSDNFFRNRNWCAAIEPAIQRIHAV
jgi:tRNAThr (cytosine32-N3)-methyltransferase